MLTRNNVKNPFYLTLIRGSRLSLGSSFSFVFLEHKALRCYESNINIDHVGEARKHVKLKLESAHITVQKIFSNYLCCHLMNYSNQFNYFEM